MLKMIDNVGSESFKAYGKGKIFEMKNQLDSALIFCKEFQKLRPTDQGGFRRTARVQRKLKNFEEAENDLNKIFISSPYSASALYEMALVQWEKGDREEAWKYLNKALDVWAEADEEYIYAKKARETKMEWERITSDN